MTTASPSRPITADLDDYDRKRYARQILIKGIGEEGQRKLKNARIFVAGAGGLGSPVAIYLAVAGFGHITLADQDVVDLSNLNRQILHWDRDVGRPKVESGRDKLTRINEHIEVNVFKGTIDEGNVRDLTAGHDLIVDAMDNFPTRFLLNRASLSHRIPFIHASVWGMEGRMSTFVPGRTPCLECVFPHVPPKEVFPILGATAGVLGALQVTEAVKVITGVGRTLENRLLVYDGEYMEFHELEIRRDACCSACCSLEPHGEEGSL